MQKKVRFWGLDVHAETIAVAVAEQDGEVRSLGVIPNRAESVRKLIKKLSPAEQLRACYEAGPTGYELYREIVAGSSLLVGCSIPGSQTARGSGQNQPAGCLEPGQDAPCR